MLTILNESDHESIWLSRRVEDGVDKLEYFREGFECRSILGARVQSKLKGNGVALEVDMLDQQGEPIVQYFNRFYQDDIVDGMLEYLKSGGLPEETEAAGEEQT